VAKVGIEAPLEISTLSGRIYLWGRFFWFYKELDLVSWDGFSWNIYWLDPVEYVFAAAAERGDDTKIRIPFVYWGTNNYPPHYVKVGTDNKVGMTGPFDVRRATRFQTWWRGEQFALKAPNGRFVTRVNDMGEMKPSRRTPNKKSYFEMEELFTYHFFLGWDYRPVIRAVDNNWYWQAYRRNPSYKWVRLQQHNLPANDVCGNCLFLVFEPTGF
jgi:hypothetical protein